MTQQVTEESTKVNLEKSVAIKEENSVTFKITSVEDLVEYVGATCSVVKSYCA